MSSFLALLQDRNRREELYRWAYWLVPPLFCLILYIHGLRAWYQQDDFVWLAQRYRVSNLHDFLIAVFGPSQHGTFRPLSERLLFLVMGTLFGTDALPARMLVFATQFVNLALLSSITRRISGSRVAGFLAPILWVVNGAVSFPMTWTSAYMQILCGFCLLLAFHCFLRYIETGRRSYYWAQWAVFLMGFLVMESNVVYPAIAAAYALLCARKYFRSTLPLFGASALFLVLDTLLVPKQHGGIYTIHFDFTVFSAFATYWKWVLTPMDWKAWQICPPGTGVFIIVALTVAVVAYLAFSVRKKQWLPLFGVAWFLILLAPVLPLTDHVSNYYLTLPVLGVALVGALAAGAAAHGKRWMKIAAAVLIALYLWVHVPYSFWASRWWYVRSKQIQAVVLGVIETRHAVPDKPIVLTGVNDVIFNGAVWDGGFRAFGVSDVYVDPGEYQQLSRYFEPAVTDASSRFLDAADFQRLLLEDRVLVVAVRGMILLDVTLKFRELASTSAETWPHRVDVGSRLSTSYLRGTWYALEADHRWMGKTAGVVMAGPQSEMQKLTLHAYCSSAQLANGPLTGTVLVDGKPVGKLNVTRGNASFDASFALPKELVGKASVEVSVHLDRTYRAGGDIRDLGLSFGAFEIR